MNALYDGELVHVRRDRWAARTFRHRMSYVALDLDDLPRLRTLSYGRPNLFALHDRDHHVADGAASLAEGARAAIARAGLPPPARLALVTQLRILGRVFNPVSFFLGYDADGAMTAALLEVNNTYGGHRIYAVDPRDPQFDRDFVVSPFQQGAARYHVRLRDPGDLAMDLRGPDGATFFHARLTGTPRPLDDLGLVAAAVRHPIRSLALIYWEAMKLHWARVPYRRP